MLVAIDDMIGWHVLGPVGCSLIVTRDILFRRALEDGNIQVLGVETDDIDQVLPSHINGTFLEVVAEGPVTKHLEHRVMVGVVAHFLEIVVLATDAQALLRVCTTTWLRILGAEDDIFPLVHTSVGEHECRIVFDDHGSGGYDGMSLLGEELLEALADFVGCAHLLYLQFDDLTIKN